MSTIRNFVQLMGNAGNAPEITDFESGKKVARFSLATNESYYKEGELHTETQWHRIVAWGKTAEIIEGFVTKGKEIAVHGKLATRSYEGKYKQTHYVTEIVANEVVLLGKPE